jgi:hypothetical protein
MSELEDKSFEFEIPDDFDLYLKKRTAEGERDFFKMWDEFKGLGTKSELEKILWTEGFEVVRQHQGGHDE